MKKTFLSVYMALMAVANLFAADSSSADNGDWDWVVKDAPIWNEGGPRKKLRYYTYNSHPEYMVFPHGNHLCEECGEKTIEQQFVMLSVYDNKFNLVRIVKLNREWLSDGRKKPVDVVKMVPLQVEYGKAGVKDKMSENTQYAIENNIGLRNDQERIQDLALKYKLYSYMKNNPNAQASMSDQEKKDFDADWAKLQKLNVSQLKKDHYDKMDDDAAFQWEKQMKADLKVDDYQIVNISRIDNLSFKVEMADDKGHKFDARITFLQKERGKFGVYYKVEPM